MSLIEECRNTWGNNPNCTCPLCTAQKLAVPAQPAPPIEAVLSAGILSQMQSLPATQPPSASEGDGVPYGPTGKRICYDGVPSHPLIPANPSPAVDAATYGISAWILSAPKYGVRFLDGGETWVDDGGSGPLTANIMLRFPDTPTKPAVDAGESCLNCGQSPCSPSCKYYEPKFDAVDAGEYLPPRMECEERFDCPQLVAAHAANRALGQRLAESENSNVLEEGKELNRLRDCITIAANTITELSTKLAASEAENQKLIRESDADFNSTEDQLAERDKKIVELESKLAASEKRVRELDVECKVKSGFLKGAEARIAALTAAASEVLLNLDTFWAGLGIPEDTKGGVRERLRAALAAGKEDANGR